MRYRIDQHQVPDPGRRGWRWDTSASLELERHEDRQLHALFMARGIPPLSDDMPAGVAALIRDAATAELEGQRALLIDEVGVLERIHAKGKPCASQEAEIRLIRDRIARLERSLA